MKTILSALALGSLVLPTAQMPTAITTQKTSEQKTTNTQTNNQLKVLNLQTNGMLGHHEFNYHSGNIVPFEKLQGGCGSMFNNPICEPNDDGTYHINLSTKDKRQSERLIHQGYTLDVEIPAHSNYRLDLNLNGSFDSNEDSFFHRLFHKQLVDASIQLFNLGDSCHNHPQFFTNHNWDQMTDAYQVDELNFYDRNDSDTIWRNTKMTTHFDLSNPTDKPMKVSHYFSLSMFLGGYNEEIANTSAIYDANISFKATNLDKNVRVINCNPNGMLGYHEFNYYSGNTIPYEKLQGGCGNMFNDPVCNANEDGTYYINLSTKDKRQSERLIHQGYTLDIEIPAHSNYRLDLNLNGCFVSGSDNTLHIPIIDTTVQLFNLGDSCHNHPQFFTNHNFDKKSDTYQADELHFYDNITADHKWTDAKMTTHFDLSNPTDKAMKVTRYFSLSMFIAGYEKEIINTNVKYDANLSFTFTDLSKTSV